MKQSPSFFSRPSQSFEPPLPLRFWHGLLGLVLAFAMSIIAGLFLELLSKAGMELLSWPMMSLQTIVISTILSIAAISIVVRLRREWKRELGLASTPLIWIVIAAAGIVPVGILTDQVTFWLHQLRPTLFTTEWLGTLDSLFKDTPFSGFILLTLVMTVGPAIGEELMFRGLVLRSFTKDMSAPWAILYSSILFGIIHLGWLQGTGAGLLGVYLAIVVYKTGSIYPAMAAHFTNNLICSIVARYNPLDAAKAYQSGYSPIVLVSAVVSSVLIVGAILRLAPKR